MTRVIRSKCKKTEACLVYDSKLWNLPVVFNLHGKLQKKETAGANLLGLEVHLTLAMPQACAESWLANHRLALEC